MEEEFNLKGRRLIQKMMESQAIHRLNLVMTGCSIGMLYEQIVSDSIELKRVGVGNGSRP